MAEKKDDDGGFIGFIIVAITVMVLGVTLLTPLGIILGIISYIILYVFLDNYFIRRNKEFLRGFSIFISAVFFYFLAYYLGETYYGLSIYKLSWTIVDNGITLMFDNSIDVGIKYIWDSYGVLPLIVIICWVIGGASITTLFLTTLHGFGHSDIKKIKRGLLVSEFKKNIQPRKFKSLDIKSEAIGISFRTRKKAFLTSKMFNQMVLALGTTGSGKTEMLKNIYARNILNGLACIVVDGKPDNDNINYLRKLAKSKGVPFYSFNCAEKMTYDFLNIGSATELKDKIIGLKNEDDWDSDYYKTQAETYLQTSIEVLKIVKDKITLDDIIDIMDFEYLQSILPSDLDERTQKKISRIKDIETKDLKGIQNQLSLLANSDMGNWLSSGQGDVFTLLEAIENKGFVYFALPSLKYPSFAKVMGKLIVNDLKTVLYEKKKETPVYSIFDEFSVFAGEQVLNLVNQGRGLGLYSGFGIQSLADLSKGAGQDFLEIFMGNINTIMCQRVNDNKTTKYIADWVGKYKSQEYQAHINEEINDTGAVKIVEKFLIDPSELQRLNTGEAFLITKVGGFGFDKIKVNYLGL